MGDYLGIPPGTYTGYPEVCALPFRAYNLIYNEHYRDQDLCDEVVISTASGWDTTTEGGLVKVAWEKDYFTTARPWEQKGTEVMVPIGEEAPIYGDNMDFDGVYDTGNLAQVRDAQGSSANLRSLRAGEYEVFGHNSGGGT